MKIVNGSHTQTIIRDFRYAEFEPNRFVYSISINGADGYVPKNEGITNKKGIASLKKSGYVSTKNQYTLLGEEMYADFLHRGYLAFLDYKNKNEDNYRDDIFDYIVAGGDLARIVCINTSDHSVWRIDGTMFPTPITFDYISAKMNSNTYDIPRALEILMKRNDVIFLDDHNEIATEPSVKRVPYYNSDCGHSCLAFLWKPTQEQADRIYAESKKGGFGSRRFQLVFDEDMLGLRAGGAALFDDYYGEYASEDDG